MHASLSAGSPVWDTVRRLVDLVVEHNLAELEVDEDGTRIHIKGQVVAVAAPTLVTAGPGQAQVAPASPSKAHTTHANLVALESPMVGVFYRAATPGDPPFVSVGDAVRVGQPIGLIEAMKVFSEVPSERSGRIVDIVVEDGTLVHQGDPILYLEPL